MAVGLCGGVASSGGRQYRSTCVGRPGRARPQWLRIREAATSSLRAAFRDCGKRARPVVTLALSSAGLAACNPDPAPPSVVVVGSDYAFALPDTIAPGPTSFSLENTGRVEHEVAMARLKPGVTLAQAWEAMQAGGDADALLAETVGVLFAQPGRGSAGRLVVDLVPGSTYALMCFLQDSPNDPPHSALGMMASFAVAQGRRE